MTTNKKRVRIMYRRSRVELTGRVKHGDIFTGACLACGRKGKTDLHHYAYEYTTAEVRKEPLLALKNTIELGYRCHRVADLFRKLEEAGSHATLVLAAIRKKEKDAG